MAHPMSGVLRGCKGSPREEAGSYATSDADEEDEEDDATAVYWLLASGENGRTETLTIDRGGEEMLPVFSFEEEAGMFLSLGMPGEGRSLKRTTAREIVSILMGPCASVDFVALDPLPEIVCRGMADLAGLSRERFMCRPIEEE